MLTEQCICRVRSGEWISRHEPTGTLTDSTGDRPVNSLRAVADQRILPTRLSFVWRTLLTHPSIRHLLGCRMLTVATFYHSSFSR